MNETIFQKIKIFLCGCGAAFVAFLFFLLRGKKLHDNRNSDESIDSVSEELSGTAADIHNTNEQFAESNQQFADLIADIKKTESEN